MTFKICGSGQEMQTSLIFETAAWLGYIAANLVGMFYVLNQKYLFAECGCVTTGTVNNSNVCDTQTGQCICKPSITGLNCTRCKVGYS